MAGGLIADNVAALHRASMLAQQQIAREDEAKDAARDRAARRRQQLIDAGWSSSTVDGDRTPIECFAEDTSAYERLGHRDPLSTGSSGRRRRPAPKRLPRDLLALFGG